LLGLALKQPFESQLDNFRPHLYTTTCLAPKRLPPSHCYKPRSAPLHARQVMNSDIPVTETQTDTEMIDISETHTETNTEKIFNTDTIYI